MIVPSMDSNELAKEILQDSRLVDRKAEYLIEGHRRSAIKSKNKCFQQIIEYKSKSQNNWLILINYFKGLPTLSTTVYYWNEYGINAILVNPEQKKLYRFSPHFLIRYNQRFLKQENISKLDLLKRFISCNRVGTTEFGKSINDNDQWIFCRFSDGIGLGLVERLDYEKSIYHFRTFISKEMAYEDQKKSIAKASDFYEKYCHEMQKYTGLKSI